VSRAMHVLASRKDALRHRMVAYAFVPGLERALVPEIVVLRFD